MNDNKYFLITILSLQTIYNCILSIVGQYIYGYFLEIYPNIPPKNGTNRTLNFDEQLMCVNNSGENENNSAQIWAQEQSADLIFQATLWRAFPVIITTYLFGVYASKINRRLSLSISIIGNTIHVIIYQAIIYKNLPQYWWYISAFIAGLTGGTNILTIVINLIMTESTNENERSIHFIYLGGLTTGLSSLVTFAIGYYIQWRGFTDLFWIAIGMGFASFLSVIFLLKTPYTSSIVIDETSSLLSSASSNNQNIEIRKPVPSNCFDICKIFTCRHHSRNKSACLLLMIFSYIFHLLSIASMSPLLFYLLSSPFCWTSKDIGNFSAVSLISAAIFSVLGMKLLNTCGANDALICAFGHVCFFAYSLWIALAKSSWELYLTLLINPFSGYQNALTVSMISKWVEVNERNHVFTLVTEINTIILAFGTSISNWIYARTVTYEKNFILLIASGLSIVPFLLNVCLFIITRRHSNGQPSVQIDVEPTTFTLPNNLPPQAADVASLICTSYNDRSRANSHCSTDDLTERSVIL